MELSDWRETAATDERTNEGASFGWLQEGGKSLAPPLPGGQTVAWDRERGRSAGRDRGHTMPREATVAVQATINNSGLYKI